MLQDLRRVGKVYEIQGLIKIRTLPDRLVAKKVDSAHALIGRKYLIVYFERRIVRIACS